MPITLFNLAHDIQLRINSGGRKSNGSILLKTAEGSLWECVECSEQFESRCTGAGWLNDFLDNSEDNSYHELIKERNAKPVTFKNLRDPSKSVGSIKVHECDLLSPIHPIEKVVIKYSKWDPAEGALELHTERDIEKMGSSSSFETRTDYTNMLLLFELVLFNDATDAAGESPLSAPKKRARGD